MQEIAHVTLGEELYANWRTRDLWLKALGAVVLGATTLLVDLTVPGFVLLYALQVGFSMWITAPMMYAADQPRGSQGRAPRAMAVIVAAMVALWGVAVLLPLWMLWGQPAWAAAGGLQGFWGKAPWLTMAAPAVVFLGSAIGIGWRYLALPDDERAAIDFKRPVRERALCLIAFVFFGPKIVEFLMALGEGWPPLADPRVAVVLTYALCEAYPFAAAGVDRMLARGRA